MSYADAIKQLQIDVEKIEKRLSKMEIRFASYVGFLTAIIYFIDRITK